MYSETNFFYAQGLLLLGIIMTITVTNVHSIEFHDNTPQKQLSPALNPNLERNSPTAIELANYEISKRQDRPQIKHIGKIAGFFDPLLVNGQF